MTARIEKLIKSAEEKISELDKRIIVLETNYKSDQIFINDLKGYVKKFYYTVTVSLIATIVWIANAVLDKSDIGL